ncbi:MAG: helix-turn-helix domain-containing protein [Acidiferrobacterales bacterium]|nr:helix-turn-helix domain-containing protein [Acidiferrobacterales bacterium]
MSQKIDLYSSSSEQILDYIAQQLEQARLALNLSQAKVALEAGVSRRTITRMEAGEAVSLDTFVRVLKVYGMIDRLAVLFPDQSVRPLDRVKLAGKQRQRASAVKEPSTEAWVWGDGASENSQGNDRNE